MDGTPTDKPCRVIACGQRKNNVIEPRLNNPVCEDHQHLSAIEISQCSNDPWARMRLLGDYLGCPPKYDHRGGSAE